MTSAVGELSWSRVRHALAGGEETHLGIRQAMTANLDGYAADIHEYGVKIERVRRTKRP